MDLRSRRGAGEVALVLTLTTVILVACSYYLLKIYFENTGIVPGITFLGHDLGYLRQEKALTRIEQIVRSTYSKPIYLKYRDRLWILRYGEHFKLTFDAGKILLDALEVGRKRTVWERISNFVYLDYPDVKLGWNPSVDRAFSLPNIAKTLKKVSRAKIFAKPSTEPGTIELTILSGEMAVQRVIDALEKTLEAPPLSDYRVVELASLEKGGTVKVVPLDDPENGFTKPLAENVTRYDVNDRPRVANIEQTLARLQGQIINPGDIFSFNEIVGIRSEENGFQQVPVVLKDKVEPDIEAGVRQVATTLYKPALLIGAKVIERSISDYYTPAIDYCKQGLEATVVTSGADLKFQNTLDFPVLIEGTAEQGSLSIKMLGIRTLPYKVDIRLGRLQKISYDTKIKKDSSLLRGLEVIDQIGIDGYEIKVFRTYFTLEGVSYREELLYEKQDEYLARTAIVRIGTASSSNLPLNPTIPNDVSAPPTQPESGDNLDFLDPLGY